ncbi:MAG TPA: hypothetical protein VFR37_20585 [Longimicrobium sp.]|nr:hypothetical protein [Longimicrobium sp.]
MRDFFEALAGLATTLGILAAGIWAVWRFGLEKEREPRAEFDITAEFLGIQDGKWLLEVNGLLTNRGKVRHLMKNASLNIRYLKAADPVRESDIEDHFRQVEFPHAIGRRKIWWDSYIDPGLEFRNSYLAWVPAEATYILVLCQFEYDRGQWPAQRVLRVPAVPRPGEQ